MEVKKTIQNDIDKELRKACETQEAVAAQDALRAQAERIPELLREKSLQNARERADSGLEVATAQAAQEFTRLAQEVPLLRKRLQALIDAVKPLADDIGKRRMH